MFIVVVAFWVFFFIFCLPFLCASSFFMNCHGTDMFLMHVCEWKHFMYMIQFYSLWFDSALQKYILLNMNGSSVSIEMISFTDFSFKIRTFNVLKAKRREKKNMISSFYFDSIFEWKRTEWAKNKVSDDTKTTEKLPEFDEMGKTMRMKWNVLIKWKGNSYTLIYAHLSYKDRHK